MLITGKSISADNIGFISIHLMLMLIWREHIKLVPHHKNFNTSHVNVNLRHFLILPVIRLNFNTSHVNVNLYTSGESSLQVHYFNTSHVNVNLGSQFVIFHVCFISIHLMLMLIYPFHSSGIKLPSISIHLMLMLILLHQDMHLCL